MVTGVLAWPVTFTTWMAVNFPLSATDVRTCSRARKRLTPRSAVTTDICDVITSPAIDAVAVVTPVWTHFELAKAALENGKHIFVEKPFTSTVEQAAELIDLADRKTPSDHGRPHVPLHRRREEDAGTDR